MPRKRKRRERGTGTVYPREGSKNYMLKYRNTDGEMVQESSGVSDYDEALTLLKTKLARVELGETVRPGEQRLTVGQLYASWLENCETAHYRDLGHIKKRWSKHLAPVFSSVLASKFDKSMQRQYVKKRQQDGARDGTINRELSIIRAAFYLAADDEKLRSVPKFIQLKENNARNGTLEDAHYESLLAACAKTGSWLAGVFETAYTFGWRSGGLKQMRVGQVDLFDCKLELTAAQSKNGAAVTAYFAKDSELYRRLVRCVTGKAADAYLFSRDDKGKRPVKSFKTAWKNACTAAGVPSLLFHDLRRTARSNMRRAGVPDKIVNLFMGWSLGNEMQTRYDVTAERDMRDAAELMERGRQARFDALKRRQQEEAKAAAAVPDAGGLATVSATVGQNPVPSTNEVQ